MSALGQEPGGAPFQPSDSPAAFEQAVVPAQALGPTNDAVRDLSAYQRLLTEVEARLLYGTNSREAGLRFYQIGLRYLANGQWEEALPMFQRSLRLIEPLPDDDANRKTKGDLYLGLGLIYRNQLKIEQARQAYEHALTYREALNGKESVGLLTPLTAMADLHQMQGEPLKPIPLLERALAIREKHHGPESEEVAATLASLGSSWDSAGTFDRSMDYLQRSLEMRTRLFGSNSVPVAKALADLGSLYSGWGDSAKAVPLLTRSAELFEASYTPDDSALASDWATSLEKLGVAQMKQGEFRAAMAAFQRSLSILEAHFGAASIRLGGTLNSMAFAYLRQEEFQRALPLLQRAMRILENAPPDARLDLVNCMKILAGLYCELGDDEGAEQLFARIAQLAETQPQAKTVSPAQSLIDIGRIAVSRRDVPKALASFERALELLERAPQESDKVADVLVSISIHLARTGETNRALATLQRGLALQRESLPPQHPNIADTLNSLGVQLSWHGKWDEAEAAFLESVVMTCAVFGSYSPDSVERLRNYGWARLWKGEPGGLVDLFDAGLRERRYLLGQSALGASREWEPLQRRAVEAADSFQTLCGHEYHGLSSGTPVLGATYSALIKALGEETEAEANKLDAEGRTRIRGLEERRRLLEQRVYGMSPSREPLPWSTDWKPWRASERNDLEKELAAVQRDLAAASERVVQAVGGSDLPFSAVFERLPARGVLVDIVQYRRATFGIGTNEWKESRYAAYLTFPLPKGSTNLVAERVDLGEAAPIDQAVAELHRFMRAGQIAARRLDPVIQRLSDLVYAPLAKHLTNVEHLIICPDGQLNRLPFEVLRAEGRHLIETKSVTYVTSGREVARLAEDRRPVAREQRPKSVVMGNPDFDMDLGSSAALLIANSSGLARAGGESPASATTKTNDLLMKLAKLTPSGAENPRERGLSRTFFAELDATNLTVGSAAARNLVFTPLPQAEEEAKAVAALLGEEAVLRLGRDARESEVKWTNSPRVLHLATHGFYLPDQRLKATDSVRNSWLDGGLSIGGDGFSRRRFGVPGEEWENPLVRCGLALAGANRALQITNSVAEDGLLTGFEASQLNLSGTELVILSACDTGSGDVKIGEGVMSLRRAFRIAGAESVLASQWPVSDQATKFLMTEFMRRWRAVTPRGQAWREAQLELLRSKDYSSPYFWAAFTLTGQWR